MSDTRNQAYRLLIADVYELAGLSRRISDRDAAAVGSTAARWHLLSALSEKPATVAEVARRLGQTRQSVQRVADDLTSSGDLARQQNPAHARSDLYTLTKQGAKLLKRLWAVSTPSRERVLNDAGLTTKKLVAASTHIRALRDAVRQLEG